MRTLFLDDMRQEPEGAILVKDFWEFKRTIVDTPEGFDVIWFDHDLGDDDNKTGMHCLDFLIGRCEFANYPRPKIMRFHSMNGYAASQMMQTAQKYFPEAEITREDGSMFPMRGPDYN